MFRHFRQISLIFLTNWASLSSLSRWMPLFSSINGISLMFFFLFHILHDQCNNLPVLNREYDTLFIFDKKTWTLYKVITRSSHAKHNIQGCLLFTLKHVLVWSLWTKCLSKLKSWLWSSHWMLKYNPDDRTSRRFLPRFPPQRIYWEAEKCRHGLRKHKWTRLSIRIERPQPVLARERVAFSHLVRVMVKKIEMTVAHNEYN